jgi:hypothetical protein
MSMQGEDTLLPNGMSAKPWKAKKVHYKFPHHAAQNIQYLKHHNSSPLILFFEDENSHNLLAPTSASKHLWNERFSLKTIYRKESRTDVTQRCTSDSFVILITSY